MKYRTLLACILCMLMLFPITGMARNLYDLNAATLEQLLADNSGLISKELAHSIVEYRTKHGKFTAPEDLLKVSGITQSLYDELYPFIMRGTVFIEVDIPKGVSPY